jgi:hypothetical protein
MKKIEKGFSAPKAVLIVVIIGTIAATAYYIWNSNKNSNSANNSSQSANSNYFVIKQWNVKAPYTGNLTLKYQVNPDVSGVSYAYLSSDQLEASDKACKQGGFGGSIIRYKSDKRVLTGDNKTDSGQAAAEYAATLDTSEYSHIGDYYYFYGETENICGSGTKSNDLQTQTSSAVKALISKLQPA